VPKGKPAPAVTTAPGPDLARLMPLVGLGVALWASLPKYSGPRLSVSSSKEFADHIVPAVVVLLASIAGIAASRRPQGPGAIRFMAGMAVLLAGLWMMATHIPLVSQTARGGPDAASWAATIYHTSAALAVFGLGLLWATVTWSEAGDESGSGPAAAPKAAAAKPAPTKRTGKPSAKAKK
jgi:hypothetical protein